MLTNKYRNMLSMLYDLCLIFNKMKVSHEQNSESAHKVISFKQRGNCYGHSANFSSNQIQSTFRKLMNNCSLRRNYGVLSCYVYTNWFVLLCFIKHICRYCIGQYKNISQIWPCRLNETNEHLAQRWICSCI